MKLGPTALWGVAAAGIGVPAGALLGGGAGLWGPPVVLGACALSVGGLGATLGLASALPALQLYGEMVTNVPTGLALTFDDGPHPEATPRLLDLLDAHGHRATCFLLADRVRTHPHLARQIVERGHEVGVHGLTHSSTLTWRSPAAGARWLGEARQVLEEVCGTRARWFRPPFGVTSPRLFASAAAAGLEVAWCSVRTGDGGRITAETLDRRCAGAGEGDIVLMHEGPTVTLSVLPGALARWAAAGLQSRTLSEALP